MEMCRFMTKQVMLQTKGVALPSMFGNVEPRLVLSVERDLKNTFSYSRRKPTCVSWSDIPRLGSYLDELVDKAVKLMRREVPWSRGVLNLYRDGLDSVPWHSDLDSEIHPIVSYSLGEKRRFRIRDKKTRQIYYIDMKNGSVLIMFPSMHKKYEHELTKVKGEKGERLGPRINVTLRP
jgi:alkylated DNA repair dioxygenase AlkB